MKRSAIAILLFCLAIAPNIYGQKKTRDTAVREDKQKLADDESWFYDNLDSAMEAARKTKRPLMIVFR